MSSKRRLMAAGLTVVIMAALGACGGGGGKDDDDPWRDSTAGGGSSDQYDEGEGAASTATTVTGLRDDVRHISRKTAKATRPHMVRKCRSSKGSRKCTTVRSGTETYTRVVRQERWCVSLNDVGGDTSKDAVWYQVTQATYAKAVDADRLDKLRFTPTATGC
ncbi:hypothetical protein [Streptomyces sp. NBC_00576]|uniref:hypothetical protein n=1 Tax=Streptomyces sp. NBC_00576 TaxID=2903665 RepID=UPI002E7FD4D2|nr:hypothetical protein [Streptomyces sp. NBC_00576]WUB72577.1 hypothetical protein OG734_22045 [Streptomyces sp. NBC_00576]